MSPKKIKSEPIIKYELEFLPYKVAVEKFDSEDGLLNALKEGNGIAWGDHYSSPEQEIPGDRRLISSWCWRHYKFNGETLFGGVDEHGSSDPEFYCNIVIEKSSIEEEQEIQKTGRGRRPAFDWEHFWRAVAFNLFMAASDKDGHDLPSSLKDWARNAPKDYEYVWKNRGKAPGETTLEDKLRPLYEAISAESDEILRKAVRTAKS